MYVNIFKILFPRCVHTNILPVDNHSIKFIKNKVKILLSIYQTVLFVFYIAYETVNLMSTINNKFDTYNVST